MKIKSQTGGRETKYQTEGCEHKVLNGGLWKLNLGTEGCEEILDVKSQNFQTGGFSKVLQRHQLETVKPTQSDKPEEAIQRRT